MSCCGVTIEAHRNADLRKTYSPRGSNYTFAGFSPLMQIRDGSTVLMTISLSATANGSVFSVVDDTLVLTLKKADVLALASGPGDRMLSYDIVLSQGGIESWFVGGDFIVLDINATTTEGEQNVTVDLDGQTVDVTIMGGNIGIGASVLLTDLNAAVQSAEDSADAAAASLASVPGLATTAGAAAGATSGASAGASAGTTAGTAAGTAAANAVFATLRQPVGGVTYYVRKDGNDSNNGLANNAAGAFLTIQRAVNAAYAIDAKGAVVQIQIGDGTYNESVNIYGRLVGAFDNGDQPFRIIGNEANPSAVVINPTNADAVRVGDKATLLLAGVTIRTTTSGNGIAASNHAFIQHRNCRFGNVAGEMIATTSKAFVQAIGDTTVAGDAASFVHATNNSLVTFSGRTLTYEGTRTFSTYLYGLNTSVLDLSSATIIGKGGGGITVHVNSILNVSSCVGVWTGGQPMFVSNGGLISAEDKVAAKTFYVRNDGNNQNSGFDNTPDGAFFSLGAALNRLRVMPYDLVSQEDTGSGSYDWRIVLAAGTFDEAVELPDTRFSRVTIQGASPTTTIAKSYVSRAIRTNWTITNQQLGGAGVTCLTALEGAQLNFSNISVIASGYIGICDVNARMSSLGQPFSISGNLSAAFLTRFGGRVQLNGSAVTITGTPSIGRFAIAQTNASVFANGMTFTGSATGNRYDVSTNGVIDTNGGGANFFPGNAAGSAATGGQYV